MVFSVILFAVCSAILFTSGKDEERKRIYPLPDIRIYFGFFMVMLVVSGYYSILGGRTALWFILFAAYTLLTLFYGSSDRVSVRNFAAGSLILLALITSTMPILQNQGIIFGPDQWRDVQITSYIVREGSFESSLISGYYAFLPLFNLVNAVLTSVTGWQPMTTFLVINLVYACITIISIYCIFEGLFKSKEAPFIALLIFMSTPRLAIIQAVPSIASISLGVFLLFILVESRSSLIYIMPLASFTTSVLHPIGVIPLLTLAATLIIISYLFIRFRLNSRYESYVNTFLITCFTVTIVYWSIDSKVLTGVVIPLRRLISILVRLELTRSVYTPQYFESEFLLFAYPWALPVALTGVFIVYHLLKGRKEEVIGRDQVYNVTLASSLVSATLIGVAFLSVIFSPGAAIERYTNVPAYTLMLFPSVMVIRKIMQTKQTIAILTIIAILSVNVYLGSSAPDWAPLENPTFGSYSSTYRGYLEANVLAGKMPHGLRVYQDNDLPIVAVSSLLGHPLIQDSSYQTIRSTINDFKSNQVDYSNRRVQSSIVYLRIREVQDQNLFMEPINVLYSSGKYSGLKLSIEPV